MRKTLLAKGLVIGIIILFIGTSVLPNISGNILNKNEKIQTYTSNTGASSSLNNSIYDLLIITPSDFQKSLEPLKEHKNKYGVKTNIVTLDQIYNDIVNGRDNPEKIKLFIKKAFDDAQIKYVLLVGNFRKVPIRYVNNADINFNEPYFISELYYADIVDKNGNFSSWDTNNNGIYGEWNNDEAQDKDIDVFGDHFQANADHLVKRGLKGCILVVVENEENPFFSSRLLDPSLFRKGQRRNQSVVQFFKVSSRKGRKSCDVFGCELG